MLDTLIQIGLDNPYPFTVRGYEGQFAALDGFDSSAWVGKITAPVLVLAGDEDLIFREKMVHALAQKIPQAQYYCFENCGHLPQIEYPALYVDVVRRFMSQDS